MNCENEAKKEIDVTNHIEVGHSQFVFDSSTTKIDFPRKCGFC